MKTLQPEFAAHIQSGATTLATCWRLVRRDDVKLGFTDHDVALTFDGTEFTPSAGADGSELTSKSGASIDTAELMGVLSGAAITEDDVRLGRYDNAVVEIWRVNWRNPEVRQLMRRDTIGEITNEDGYFKAELRSPEMVLNVDKGRLYQPLCGTNLGETPCGISLASSAYKSASLVGAVVGRAGIQATGLSGFAPDWFMLGNVVWTSGRRVGVKDRIIAQDRKSGKNYLTFEADIIDWIEPGDTFDVYAGCDRRFSTCRHKFSNQTNFRGFPHIPGRDFVVKYPKEGDVLAGAPLIK